MRGYPFSLREGAPTAVSHGLWLNIPDYDAPTQLVKPLERNTRYVIHWWNKRLNLASCLIRFQQYAYDLSGMWMLFWPFQRAPCSPCVVWICVSTVTWSDLQCTLVLWVMVNQLVATTICGLAGAPRYTCASMFLKICNFFFCYHFPCFPVGFNLLIPCY